MVVTPQGSPKNAVRKLLSEKLDHHSTKEDKGGAKTHKAPNEYIEQAPWPARIVTVLGSGMCFVNVCIIMFHPLGIFTNSVNYVISVYQLVFCVITSIFEVNVDWLQSAKWLEEFQDLLILKAKFLSELLGRAAVFLFQGSLWLCFAETAEIFTLICGVYMVLLGILLVVLHYTGFTHKAEKALNGYRSPASSQ